MTRFKYRPEEVAAALEQSGGNKCAAARILGCSRDAIQDYFTRHEQVRAAWKRAIERRVAAGESGATPIHGSHGPHFDVERIAAALEEARGNMAAAARAAGCSQNTIRMYIARHEQVRAARERVVEARVAAGESGLAPKDGLHGPRFSIEQVAAAVEQARGDKARAARAVGCSRRTINSYIARYAPVREAYRRAYDACVAAGERRPATAPDGLPGWRYPVEEMAEAVRQARGLTSVAARSLGCSNQVVLYYIKHRPEVREAYEEARAGMIDIVENKVSEAVDRGDLRAVNFVLSVLGADRGYTKKRTPAARRVDAEAMAEFEAALKAVMIERGEWDPSADEVDLDDREPDADEVDLDDDWA